MEKIKNLLSPGHKEDDASSSSKPTTTQSSNLTSDISSHAKNIPGSSYPDPGDDPSKVSQHMPGAFANTPRDERSAAKGGLDGTSATGSHGSSSTSSGYHISATTGHSSSNPVHGTTAAPASAATASAATAVGAVPVHSGTIHSASGASGHAPVNPGHSSTSPRDDTSVASVKSGIAGGHGGADSSTIARQNARETVVTHPGSSSNGPGITGTTGTATIPASGAGAPHGSGAMSSGDPSFSQRNLGSGQYGSLDPSAPSTGTNLNTLGRDATSGLSVGSATGATTGHPVHGPHQDTHSNQPGATTGMTNAPLPTSSSTLPDRSRGITEHGTHAHVGETTTHSSFPVGGQHIGGPHQTATANILDPHVKASLSPSTGTTGPVQGIGSGTHVRHETEASGVGVGVSAGTAGGQDLDKHTATVATSGTGTAVPGQALTTDHAQHVGRHPPVTHSTAGAIPSGQHAQNQQSHQKPSEHAAQKTLGGDHSKHATSHEKTTTGGLAVGAGPEAGSHNAPYAGTTEGRDQPLGASVDKGPASKTIGPHSSNLANIVDPRVRPDAAVQGSEKSSKIDPLVDGPTGAAEIGETGHKKGEHGSSSATHGFAKDVVTPSATHNKTSDSGPHGSTSGTAAEPVGGHGPQRQTDDRGKHTDPNIGGPDKDVSHGQDRGRHGLSSLLHRDNPTKLHKDPPSK